MTGLIWAIDRRSRRGVDRQLIDPLVKNRVGGENVASSVSTITSDIDHEGCGGGFLG
jgi:hypothetical protein